MATAAFLNQAYLAYFGRPVDYAAVTAWNNSTNAEVENAFYNSPESKALYGDQFNAAQVNQYYMNLFGRPAEPAGIQYWLGQVALGIVTPAGAAIAILNGARNNDIVVVQNKLVAAASFTTGLDTTDEIVGYTGDTAAASARAFLATVTNTPATQAQIDAAIDAATNNTPPVDAGTTFILTPEVAAGADSMHLTGDQDVRINFTNSANQITGLDLNGNGVIENNGIENNIQGLASGFEIVDAYARDPLNQNNISENFLGDIKFDGTSYGGDGINTNGNIVLGGLGADIILGGVGNDFLAGGGVADARITSAYNAWIAAGHTEATFVRPSDALSGGRNADFFYTELSLLSPTDGNNLTIDGGTTADDNSAGTTYSLQNTDWLLLQASDDDEPVQVNLEDHLVDGNGNGNMNDEGSVITRSGVAVTLKDVENVDASGNFYGFLDDMNTVLGGAPAGQHNGIGSSAQLHITTENGSLAANILIGGYDNDVIEGGGGNDLLMGGNLNFLIDPNMLTISNDGRDELIGGTGADNITFEADGGIVEGGATQNVDDDDIDTMWATAKSLGQVTAANADDLITDGVLRFDLAVGKEGGLNNYSGYGGADQNAANGNYTADQTNYINPALRVQVQDMENVIATGLGAIDYKAAGANTAGDLTFTNQQNFFAYSGNMDLRGTDMTSQSETYFSWFTYIEADFPSSGGYVDISGSYFGYLTQGAAYALLYDEHFTDFANNAAVGEALPTYTFYHDYQSYEFTTSYDDGVNILYAAGGNDTIEGRSGGNWSVNSKGVVTDNRDRLSGGDGIDTFIFGTMDGGGTPYGMSQSMSYGSSDSRDYVPGQSNYGDNIDVIWRQSDTDNDNLWDNYSATTGVGDFERDFGIGSSTTTVPSGLDLTLNVSAIDTTSNPLDANNVVSVAITVAGVDMVLTTPEMAAAPTMADLLTQVQIALAADANNTDGSLTATLLNNTITIADALGRVMGGLGYAVQQESGGSIQNTVEFHPALSNTVKDVLLFTSYESRADAELTNDNSFNGSTITLGVDSYAQDRVVSFSDNDGKIQTRIAEDQAYGITFTNLTTQDIVTITVNGVQYQLQVGQDLDGSSVAAEDGLGDTQSGIQANFLGRMTDFINSFMDRNTAAGQVSASLSGSTLTLTQVAYNGEETVFMKQPIVTLGNQSGGEPASYVISNDAQHEVLLYEYDGRDNGLNFNNVKFIGATGINQSTLETALDAGQTLIGNEALVIDGGTNNLADSVTNTGMPVTTPAQVVANNLDTNADLSLNFSVHGDDLLIGGMGNDTIYGRTGDDRIVGSEGMDTVDGGKDWYAVKVLGEPLARVVEMNLWEAASPAARVAALSGLNITATTQIEQTEDGFGPINVPDTVAVFNDTLLFQQADFGTDARFTITLDDFVVTAGVVNLTHGGAGTVGIDIDGDGTLDAGQETTFTNFENIRTASGTGLAVANHNQGNDTLDVSALSAATGGISYDLTNTDTQGEVKYSVNAAINELALAAGVTAAALPGATVASVRAAILGAQATVAFNAQVAAIPTPPATTVGEFLAAVGLLDQLHRPTSASDEQTPSNSHVSDYETLVMKVDGVENVIGGSGDDLLVIAENEAAKDNSFDGSTGVDRIEYLNGFTPLAAEPTVTVKVNTSTDTDQVVMQGGRVAAAGPLGATDTLHGVEFITLGGQTAQGVLENDVLDVTAMTTGAVVDYTNGQVRTSLVPGVGVQVVIENIVQLENVWADGNDTVIVADASVMNQNTTSDYWYDATTIQLATYLDYDNLNATDTARMSFAQQVALGDASEAINQNQFTFDMSRVGTDTDVDTIDYSHETGMITAVMNFAAEDNNKYVLVQNSSGMLTDSGNRIDHLISVERIVAAGGEDSTIDLTNSDRAVNVIFSYNMPDSAADFVEGSEKITALDRQINTVRVADAADQAALGNVDLLEFRDLGDSATTTQIQAVWENVEGSDNREYVQLTQWENDINHTFNLRGGMNEVNYNERTNGIELIINSVNATMNGIDEQFDLTINQLDTTGAWTGYFDTIYGFNTNNTLNAAADGMRIEASQGFDDFINVSALGSGIFLLGEIESSGSSVVTATFDGEGQGLVMSGFEYLLDGDEDDTYIINDLINFVSKLTLIDTEQVYNVGTGAFEGSDDRDTVKLTNGSFDNTALIDVTADLHMGDGDANDLQRLGLNNRTYAAEFGDTPNNAAGGESVGFDFQVLDISLVTAASLVGQITASGSIAGAVVGSLAGTSDELIIGGVNMLDSAGTAVTNFDILSLTGAAVSYDLDLDAGELQTAGNVKLFGFDGDLDTLDLSRVTGGSTVTVTDLAGVGASVIGTAFADTITGSSGDDILTGGKGADHLDGGVIAEVLGTLVFNLESGTLGAGTNDGYVEIAANGGAIRIYEDGTMFGDTTGAFAGGEVDITPLSGNIGDNATAQAIGVAMATLSATDYNTYLNFAPGDIVSVVDTPGATSASVAFTFSAAYGDPAAGDLTFEVIEGTDTSTLQVNGLQADLAPVDAGNGVDYSPQLDSADTYVYLEGDSTEAAMDSITNFTVDGNGGTVNDMIDFSGMALSSGHTYPEFFNMGSAFANYAAVKAAALINISADDWPVIGSDGTDTWVFIDDNHNSNFEAGDTVIKLVGITAAGIDIDNFVAW